MMELRYFHVDAFTRRAFAGNPAAVVPVDVWPADATMQAIATELQLSETAFVGPDPGGAPGARRLRWFTPVTEVDLCGHATLATAHVLWRELGVADATLTFASHSGALGVTRDGDAIVLDFPSRPPRAVTAADGADLPARLAAALGAAPRELLVSRDVVAVYDDAATVRALAPDFGALAAIDVFGTIVTAPGDEPGVDFVSRFFVPQQGIDEDPVTGSAHCTLIPLWAARLGRSTLAARQVSRRGGELECALRGDRVAIGGHAVTVARGVLEI